MRPQLPPRRRYGLFAALWCSLLALALLAPSLALARPAGALTFTNLTPAPGSVVSAGETTIAANIRSTGNVGRITLVLNTQPLSFEVGGPSASQVAVFTGRILAPGEYTANLVAEDSAGARQQVTWHFTVRLTDPIPANFMQLDGKIEIVFPHNAAPVTQANLANIGAFLFTPGTRTPLPCAFNGRVVLWRAINNEPARPLVQGTKVMRTVGGFLMPTWDFNNIDVSIARNPANKLMFYVTVDGFWTNNNVWVHGADPRTFFPRQDVPTAVQPWPPEPSQLDSKIEIVFPNRPLVSQATQANIGTDIFRLGTLISVDLSRNPYVHLIRSLNADVAVYGATNDMVVQTNTGGVVHPRWVHNNVDVSQATTGTPPNLILFRSYIDNPLVETFPNIWAHGADVRTFFPIQDVPSRACQ